MQRKFKVGDRVARESDGCSGTVTSIEFDREERSNQPFWVRVKWDWSGSKSDREETGLKLLEAAK